MKRLYSVIGRIICTFPPMPAKSAATKKLLPVCGRCGLSIRFQVKLGVSLLVRMPESAFGPLTLRNDKNWKYSDDAVENVCTEESLNVYDKPTRLNERCSG